MSKVIKTERLKLRKLKLDDAEAIFNNYATDEEVTKYLTWNVHENVEFTKSLLKTWVEEDEKLEPDVTRFAITLKDDDELIGCIDVIRGEIFEIGYVLSRKYWNKGFMSEVLNAFLKYLKEIGFEKMTIKADINNIGSNRVIEKNGGIFVKKEDVFLSLKNKTTTVNVYYFDLLNL